MRCISLLVFLFISIAFVNGGGYVQMEKTPGEKRGGELFQHYNEIFKHTNNRNSASHRWVKYVFDRKDTMTKDEFADIFYYFCPVSGSPIEFPHRSPRAPYKMKLEQVGTGATVTGQISVCCSPCVCDTSDFIKTARKEVQLKDGKATFDFLVIADPCRKTDKAQPVQEAGDAYCLTKEHKMEDAVFVSDSGDMSEWMIIGMLQPFTTEYPESAAIDSYDPAKNLLNAGGMCEDRAKKGHYGGMGEIFVNLACLNYKNKPKSMSSTKMKQLAKTKPSKLELWASSELENEFSDEVELSEIFLGNANTQADLEARMKKPGCSGPSLSKLKKALTENVVVLAGAVYQPGQYYRCYVAAKNWLESKNFCYKSVDLTNEEWDYLQCLYPDKMMYAGNRMMHSYLFADHELLGNGFVVDDDSTKTERKIEEAARKCGKQNNIHSCKVDKSKECESHMKGHEKQLKTIKEGIANLPVIMFGWEPCPCVAMATERFRAKKVCYKENTWTDFNDPKMKYFQCLYGDKHHSFIFFNKVVNGKMEGGKFIGDGFALGPNAMAQTKFDNYMKESGVSLECMGKEDKNLNGGALTSCSGHGDGLTGWTRSGSCVWQRSDRGYHQVCVKMTKKFLENSAKNDGNDLSSVVSPGGHWCICAWAWASAVERDPVNYEYIELECDSTNERLRKVYQTYIDDGKKITSPSGRSYEAQAALNALNKKCPPKTAEKKLANARPAQTAISHSLEYSVGATQQQNLHGGALQKCTHLPGDKTTGWRRSGSCDWDPSDSGYHQVCVQMSEENLKQSAKLDGNDLREVVNDGGHWCICAWAWAAAVDRDPENYEGLKLDCDRTNARLRNVYQTHTSLTSPSGNNHGVALALEKVNCICDGTCANGKREKKLASVSSATWDNQTEVSKERISIQLEYFGIILLASITLILASYTVWKRSGRKSITSCCCCKKTSNEDLYENIILD